MPQKIASVTQPQCVGTIRSCRYYAELKSLSWGEVIPKIQQTVPSGNMSPMSNLSILKKILKSRNVYETFWFIYFIYRPSCLETV